MSQIQVTPLGAGEDVGRSCILVTIGGKNIMFDCGMHMGYNDERRFPDFGYISRTGQFDLALDAVIISHFHLDHSGALPYFTEMCGYNGPIFMTSPTKAIISILLEDYRKITTERKGEKNFFTAAMIKNCLKKITVVNLEESVWVDDEIEIKPFYAGHVIGAAMFYVKVKDAYSVLYTGDYNMTPDRHLGSARVNEKLRPDLLITESTYATVVRESKRQREGTFLKRIHTAVNRGGKVLIPVFAIGRAQELCILIESYWERMGLKIPIYFTGGLTEKANTFYELFINWTNQKIKSTFTERNMFAFKHIKAFERSKMMAPGPMVLFATPGMLHAGTSLEAFKKWCPDPLNMVIMPGYCVAGTIGARVLAGEKEIVSGKTKLTVRAHVEPLSFSAHADSKGIKQLITNIEPKNVMLVHGEKGRMLALEKELKQQFNIPVFHPANGEVVTMNTRPPIPAALSKRLLQTQFFSRPGGKTRVAPSVGAEAENVDEVGNAAEEPPFKRPKLFADRVIQGVVALDGSKMPKVLDPSEVVSELGIREHTLTFRCRYQCLMDAEGKEEEAGTTGGDRMEIDGEGGDAVGSGSSGVGRVRALFDSLCSFMSGLDTRTTPQHPVVKMHSVLVSISSTPDNTNKNTQTKTKTKKKKGVKDKKEEEEAMKVTLDMSWDLVDNEFAEKCIQWLTDRSFSPIPM
eukprot:TRINITY_DN9028_c0_g1_i1.p1 TRINITY_DN9028_c0_g1~~TRINITY_DN9028_c0_g1_i1.p1  ORF type:complete len:689 (-),score=124.45 TRINITY_DN9028_c0_g1_i1:74-2140(-)